ncbi:hypothetical protein B0A53_00499 [Rhodotorula sp. CCFEE 5036]|jgi:hypothetical protein|nr:hypothetical protein B0A53_00499 [Rhodotorula sp. CCFEE 5036]
MTTGTRSPRLAVPPTVPSPLTPAAESAQLLRAIAVAEVGIRQPFRRPPRQREEATTRTVAIPSAEAVTVVDIQPATPRGGLSPTQEEEAHSSESTCQPASLHSILMLDDDDDDGEEQASEEAVEIIRFEPQPAGAKGSFHYLRPDLSGASGLSIHHFEAHGRSVSSSSTETLVDFSKPVQVVGVEARLPTLAGSKKPQEEPSLMMHSRSASAPTGPVQPPQHLAELFEPPPRSYLCPWELDAPPPFPPAHLEKANQHGSDFPSPEKPLPQPISAGSSKPTRCERRWQRKHAVTAALVLLTVLILTDLVALNVRVWSLRDAYYDE